MNEGYYIRLSGDSDPHFMRVHGRKAKLSIEGLEEFEFFTHLMIVKKGKKLASHRSVWALSEARSGLSLVQSVSSRAGAVIDAQEKINALQKEYIAEKLRIIGMKIPSPRYWERKVETKIGDIIKWEVET